MMNFGLQKYQKWVKTVRVSFVTRPDFVVLSQKMCPQTVCWGSIKHIMLTYGEFWPSKISEVGQNSLRQFIDAKFNIQILGF